MNTHLFDNVTVYADICTNHHGSRKVYDELVQGIQSAGAIPKIQLYSAETFDRTWTLPETFAASVFRTSDVDYIMKYNPMVLKVASVESTHFDLIKLLMTTNVPLAISTGGMDEEELLQLLDCVQAYEPGICLMHCVSMYPTPLEHCNMHRISTLADCMEEVLMPDWVGWSCHTREWYAPLISALTQSASQLEFHVMVDSKHVKSLDEFSSTDLPGLKQIMRVCKNTMSMLGSGDVEQADRDSVLEWRGRWQDLPE